MKKRVRLVLILFFLFLVKPVYVNAECENVDFELARYNELKEQYKTTCDFQSQEITDIKKRDVAKIKSQIEECENVIISIESIATKYAKDYYSGASCKNKVETMINESSCQPLLSDLYSISNRIMRYIYIIAPILLIIFVAIDLFKILATGDSKEITKTKGNIFKRLIAFILLYLTPTIITFILSLNGSEYDIANSKDIYYCDGYEKDTLIQLSDIADDYVHQFFSLVNEYIYGDDNIKK